MEMRNILSDNHTGESFACRSVGDVLRNNTNDTQRIVGLDIHDRTTTYAMNSDSVNVIGSEVGMVPTDSTRKKAQSSVSGSRVASPSDLFADSQVRCHWNEWYKILRELELVWQKNNGRI